MNEELKNKIISVIKEKRMTIDELSKKLFISDRQLLLLLKEWGVEIPGKRKKVEMPQRNELMQIYNTGGNLAETAKHYEVSVNTIRSWMNELNIPTRKLVMTNDKKKELLEKHIGMLGNIDL